MQHGTRISLAASLLAGFAAGASADVVTDWNVKAGNLVVEAKLGTPPANRVLALVHTAVYEATNAITRRYPASRLQIEATPGASVDAAVAAANRSTLLELLPAQQASIEAAYQAALASIADGPAKAAGIAIGQQAAAATLASRTEDAAVAETYRPHATAGVYVPTAAPAATQWARRQPWLMASAMRRGRPSPRTRCTPSIRARTASWRARSARCCKPRSARARRRR